MHLITNIILLRIYGGTQVVPPYFLFLLKPRLNNKIKLLKKWGFICEK